MAEKLNLNRASVGDLEKVPGITHTLARRIVATRDRQGGFVTLAALRDITGINTELFAVLKEQVTVDAAAAQEKTQVVRVNLDPQRQHAGGYGSYKVTAELVALTVLPGTEDQVAVPRAITADASADGLATLTLPDSVVIQGLISFIVRTPDGQILARAERTKSDLRETLPLPVVPRGLPTTQPADDPAFNQPTKLRGRVIDRAGRVQIAGKQVVIWTATTDNPQDADFAAVMVAATDATGYFSGPYPIGKFTSANATVALEPTQAVTIRLNDGGTMPVDVILVVDAPRRVIDQQRQQDEGCGCHSPTGTTPRNPDAGDLVNGEFSSDIGQGRCVDFTRPDRTLQEFSYSYVVRTTEPSIKGLTLTEPTRIPPSVLGEIIKLSNLSVLSSTTTRALATNSAIDTSDDTQAIALRSAQLTAAAAIDTLELHADVWRKAVSNPDKASAKSIIDVAKTSKYLDIIRAIDKSLVVAPDRTRLSCRNPVDWDDPMIYQACTVAHGHILHFKQEWIADGYSMGRLLYSLPLAPGQKKQIAVLDWERRESAIRQESLEETESLQATLSRDRDIGEMVISVLSESSRGGSSASTSAVGGGIGIGAILGPVGGLLGIGGGASNANSTAWQNSSRNVSANSLQTLRDRTSQAAASMRTQRSTVIQTITQGERVSVTTESVANYNHCHAMTMEYFEVLRHLIVRQRIVDVQECLFVPLQMSRFDRAKALRWRHTLKTIMPERALKAGFDALERIDNNYEGSDMPTGAYADERLDYLEGELTIRFQLARPRDNDQDDFNAVNWNWMGILLPMLNPQELYRNFLKGQTLKDRIFLEQVGPRIARAFVDLMKVSWVDNNDVEHPLPIDTTLLSNFTNDTQLAVSLRLSGAVPPVARKDIKFIKISEFAFPGIPFLNVLPANSRVIVDGGQMSYRTKFSSGYLFRSGRIANDLTGSDSVRVYTPLTLQELRKPREEDKELARRLLDHLNENIERYHHTLWWRMSPDRRYMLLDGFEAPNSDGRSVASVVDNTLIGIVGNSLVMPVSRGFHLDPTFDQDVERPIDLLEHYQPNTPIEPVRVAIPTRGVYAEAVMGACNSCETKEEERFWRWEESPIPDNPPAILPVSTESRQTPTPDLTAKDFPAPIIAMQSAPAAPDPTGLAGALNLLGQSGLFKDITGLEGNQRNALEALKSSLQTAQFFGEKAGNLALQARMNKDIDKIMRAIDSAKQQGLLSDEQASQLTQGAIQSMIGAGPSTDPKAMATEDVKQVTETAGANNAAVKVTRPSGEQVEVDARAQTLPDGSVPRKASITLAVDAAAAETRAFNPATNSLTGEVSLEVQVNDAPAGFAVRWTPAEAAALEVVTADAQKTVVRGKRPGLTRLDVVVFNGGNQIAKTQLRLCVPQFVTIDEDAAKFTAVLAQLKLDTRKGDVLTQARDVCRELLKTSNVRTIWRMAPFTEAVPAHIGAALTTSVRIEGEPPNNPSTGQPLPIFGATGSGGTGIGATSFNERIVLFPGAYDVPQPASPTTQATMIDATTQAILLEVQAAAAPPAALLDLAIKVFGRLIGETMAHEITHSLLGVSVGKLGADGHNAPPVADELMNDWLNRNFRQRTGIEDTALTSPIDPNNFIDHSITAIGKLGADNQTLINARFPVPPHFT
jgi:hypothetical protein